MGVIEQSLKIANISFDYMDLCDNCKNNQKLDNYEVIILGGGHVLTQNKFFEKIKLTEKIKSFEGIIIGVSAGSMNSADEVYPQPEERREAIDPISNYSSLLFYKRLKIRWIKNN